MVTGPDMGVLGDELTENPIRIIPIRQGKAFFMEKVELLLNPMIGVIGTAPASEDISCGTPGSHGGNMDCKVIGEGATLIYMLPWVMEKSPFVVSKCQVK